MVISQENAYMVTLLTIYNKIQPSKGISKRNGYCLLHWESVYPTCMLEIGTVVTFRARSRLEAGRARTLWNEFASSGAYSCSVLFHPGCVPVHPILQKAV